jgi:hypothetical protein
VSGRRSFARGPAAYRRGTPRHPPSGKAFLVVTEGEKTEPQYLKALCQRLQLGAADVEIVHPDGTDPLTLTRRAMELRDARRREAKKGLAVAYDEVWVVFDLEKPHGERRRQAAEARAFSGVGDIQFAVSNPAFEFWLLLHGKFTTRSFLDADAVIEPLKDHWADYSKGQAPSQAFLERIRDAVPRAQRCREHHETTGGDGNPSTDVDRLARSLNSATRPHLQFAFD